jgi:hypothetical protein
MAVTGIFEYATLDPKPFVNIDSIHDLSLAPHHLPK